MNTASRADLAALPVAASTRRVHPVWLVAVKELTDMRRDARWRALLGVTLLLLAAALALGLLHGRQLDREHDAAEAGDRQVWTAQGAKNPHSAAHFGQYAFKPEGPLAVAEPGVDAYVGNAVWLEAHRQNEVQFRAARDGTLAARMGQLNLAFVLQTVLPLMAILLGYAAMSGEREQGTLRQLISLGVQPWQLLAGKALAAAAVLVALVLLASGGLGAGLAVSNALSGATPGEHAPAAALGWRLLGLGAAYGVVLLGFLALALAASCAVRSSRVALVALLVFWLVNSFAVPRWVTDVVRASDPLPTAQALRSAIAEDKKALFGHDEKHPAFIAFKNRVLAQYGVARIEDLPVSWRGLSLREDDEAGYRIFDRHFNRLQAQLEAQDRQRALAGFVFPMLALQPLSMALAGTDNRHHHHFVQAAEAQRRLIQTATSQDLIDNAGNNAAYQAPADLWARIPALQYVQPDAAWALQGQGRNAAALALWCLLCCSAAVLAVRRLRVL